MRKLLVLAILSGGLTYGEEKVILSVYQTQVSEKETTSSIDVLSQEEIEDRNPNTLLELLSSLSSLSFTSNGGFGQVTGVYLRGLRQVDTLFMVDGIRVNDPTNLNGISLEHILPVDIERVEIVKGSQSGVWGADAVSGVVNIITKKPKKGFSTDSYVEYGSFITRRYGATLSYGDDRLYLRLGVHRFDSQSISAVEPGKESIDYGKRWDKFGMEPDPYRNDTLTLKVGLNITQSDRLEFNFRSVDSVTHYDGYDPITYKLADANNVSHQLYKFYNLTYDKIISDVRLTVHYNLSDFERNYTEPTGWIKYNSYNGKLKELGIKGRWDYYRDSFLLVGLTRQDFIQKDINLDKNYHNTGFFITNLNKHGKITLSESLRLDRYSAFEDKVTYKVGIRYSLLSALDLTANYGTGYRVPLLYNLYSLYGNHNLKPQDSQSFDVGIISRWLSVNYFNYRIDNLIDFDSKTLKYTNIEGVSKVNGFELTFKQPIERINLLLWGGYTYTWATDKYGKRLPRISKDKINLNISYHPSSGLNLSIFGEYIGERRDSQFNPVNTGYYFLLHGNLNYRVNKNLSLNLKLNNITNKFYQTVDGYASPGRSLYAGMSLNY
ncbi:MAG: TonB-dependent receptor [Hydrogenothermaceae bacterium]|nr:TonB-dependent receptor [Hydrogenothermaceae bacterium]